MRPSRGPPLASLHPKLTRPRLGIDVAGESLPERPLQSVYAHLRRLYHPQNYLGPFSPEEDERLLACVPPGQRALAVSARLTTNGLCTAARHHHHRCPAW